MSNSSKSAMTPAARISNELRILANKADTLCIEASALVAPAVDANVVDATRQTIGRTIGYLANTASELRVAANIATRGE